MMLSPVPALAIGLSTAIAFYLLDALASALFGLSIRLDYFQCGVSSGMGAYIRGLYFQ